MKGQTRKKIFVTAFALMFAFNTFVLPAFAAATPALDTNTDVVSTFTGGQIVPCGTTASGNATGCGWNDLITLANNIVTFLVWVSLFLAIFAFCYAGFLYITAFGEMGKIEQAHTIFKATITGIFFALCGWLIIATILKVLVTNDQTNINSVVPFQNVTTITGQAH